MHYRAVWETIVGDIESMLYQCGRQMHIEKPLVARADIKPSYCSLAVPGKDKSFDVRIQLMETRPGRGTVTMEVLCEKGGRRVQVMEYEPGGYNQETDAPYDDLVEFVKRLEQIKDNGMRCCILLVA